MHVGNISRYVNMFLNGHVLPAFNEVKDLGVIVDSRLTFVAHIDHIVARASIRANLTHKCFVSRDTATLLRAFTVYVRPLLECASCVLSPHHTGHIARLESVLRKFTKRLHQHI